MNEASRNEPVISAEEIFEGIRQWVSIESPSTDAAAVNRMADHVQDGLARLGAIIERTPGRDGWGDILKARTQWAATARASWCCRTSTPSTRSA